MLARDDHSTLRSTPLHALHAACAGKMVPFAGYEMPVQFSPGVLREHLHTRAAAGLFDVSHMGQIALRPKSGRLEDAALALERLVPQDILGVAPGRQRYAQFTADSGGILDDLMVANFGSHLFLVVNAACKAAGRGASARRSVGQLRHRAPSRPRAAGAAGAEGGIGDGKALPGCCGNAFHGRRAAPRRRHRLLRFALRLYRGGRL